MYIEDMIYLAAIACAKLSILALYYRIFKVNRKFRLLCISVMILTVAYCISFILVYAFDCNPEYKTWNANPNIRGTCIPITTVTIVIGAFNIATDTIILVMPIPMILKLQLRLNQKIGLLAIFATGALYVKLCSM
jgi:hypothetical protein